MSHAAQSKIADKIIKFHRLFNYQVFGLEANDLGKVKGSKEPSNFEIVLQQKQVEEDVVVPLKLVWNTSPKDARIQSVEPYYSNGQLLFSNGWNRDYPELVDQVVGYPIAAHDDGPDALEGAISLILGDKARKKLVPRAR